MAKGDTAQAKINVTTNAQAAKNDIEDINNLLKKLQKTKQMMMKEGLHLTADGKETATFKKLNRDIKDAQQSLKRMVDSQTLMNKTMDNLKDIRLKELKRRYRELTKELGNFTGREKQASKQWRDNLEKIKAQISAIEGAGKGASKSFMSFGGSLKTTMKNLVAYAGVFAMFNRTKEKLSEIVKLNKEFSDQLANIRKVSNLPMDSINELATNLAKIDTRSSVQQLNELAYTGAKLGFGTLGTDALEGFVKSAVVVQNALSEDMGADAMTALSKMVEVMGLIPKLGVEKAMNSVGSAIFKLASTSTATGTNIVEFSKRLMGLANQAGITADELLAIGSAADSMALMPEVAATAFNKLITSVQKQPNLIENALHIEPGTISQMYQAGKMTDALVLIFDKMREKGGMNALMQSGVFKDLGSDGARLVAVMATMSNRVDMLKEHLETARDAFAEGTAVGQEYAIQMETAEAYSERAANMWTKAFVNPEGVNVVKSLTKAWYDMTVQLTQSQSVMITVKTLLEGLVGVLKVFISILPGLLTSLAAFSGIKGLMMLYNSLFAVEGMTIRTMLSLRGLGLMMKTNWVGWVVTAIGVLGQFVFSLAAAKDKMDEARGAMPGFKRDLGDLNVAFGAAAAEAGRFRDAILAAEKGTKERAAAIRNFKQQYGQYLSQMITEESSAYAIAKAYNEVTKALRAKIALQMKEEDISSQVAPREGWAAQRREEYNKYMGQSQYNGAWLTGVVNDALAKGTSIKDLAKQLNAKAFHLSDEIVENALKQSASGTYKDIKGVTTENGDIFRQLNGQNLWRALRYATQSYSANTALNRVNAKWKPEQDLINETLAKQGEKEVMDPLLDAPDKAAARAAKKAEAERRKALRAEMKEEQAQAKAIIDNVKNYYQRQINAIAELANTTGMDPKLQEQMVNGMKERMNEALANVRKAIGGTKNDWEAFKQTMRDDLYEPLGEDGTNLSTELLDKVMDNNLDQLRTMIEKLSKELNQQGSVLLDQILRKASENEGINAKIENALMRAREKELLERNYTGKVDKDTEGTMEQFGIAAITDAQSKQIRDWSAQGNDAAIERFLEMRTKYWQVAFGNARKNLLDLLQQDVNTKQGQESVLQLLFGEDWKEGLTGSELEGILNMTADQWQVFYMKLIEYTDRWTDAQKKAYDENKKRQDYIFENRTDVMGLNSLELGYEQKAKANQRWGKPQTFAERMGLGSMESMTNDPEVKMMEIRLTKAELYYKKMEELRKTDQISEEQLMDAKKQWSTAQEALMDKLAEQAKQKMEQIQQLLDPIKEFGAAAGDAMYLTVNGLEGEGEAWRNAVKNIIKTYGEMTIQMIEKQLLQMIVMKQHHQEQEDEEQAHQDRMKQIQNQGDTNEINAQNVLNAKIISTKRKANKTEEKEDKKAEDEKVNIAGESGTQLIDIATQVGTGMVTAKKQEADQTQQIEQQQQATSLSGLISDTVAKVVLGIAGGSAKTISELGWWGLPLVAVISAALMGLLNFALSSIGGGKGGSEKAAAKPKVKLASGMLTYDKGNVQQTVGSQWRGKNGEYITDERRTVVGDDGRVYRAREQRSLPEGVSMVTEPISTRVNGQQALVGERGPEIVIGRKTTRAIQMNRPDLLRDLALIDRGITTRKVRTFDEGNISDMATAFAGQLPAPQQSADGQQGGGDAQRERDQAMLATLGVLSQTIGQLQQQLAAGIHAEMNMFGDNGAYKKFQQADKFYKRYGG